MATRPSRNDGPARTAALEFLERVTRGGTADSVPPAARVAVLDNDGAWTVVSMQRDWASVFDAGIDP